MTTTETIQAGLVSLLSTMAARIKTPGELQDIAYPYIVHFPLGGEPVQTHGKLAAINRQYQISIFGTSLKEVTDIAGIIRSAFGNAVVGGVGLFLAYDLGGMYNPEVLAHQWNLTFNILE